MPDIDSLWKKRLTQATEELGYELHSPPSPHALEEQPLWLEADEEKPEAVAIRRILDEEWRVAFLRDQIRKLGVKPQGRSRLDLATQLVETFIDPRRLQTAVDDLSDAARTYYAQVLFNLRLPRSFVADSGKMQFLLRPDGPLEPLLAEILDAGLAFEQDGELFIPNVLLKRMPGLYLPLASLEFTESPDDAKPAQPLRSVQQIQQLLGLVRSHEGRLRPERSWTRRPARYMDALSRALPTPEDARRLNRQGQGEQLHVALMAPEPCLAPKTLARWATVFDGDEDAAELMYHLLRGVGVLRPGSPITLEPDVTERFLALAPGRQLALLLRYYVAVDDYDLFWSQWRDGRVQVRWQYRPYQGLRHYDFTLGRALYHLRMRLLEFLALLPPDQWLSSESVLDLVQDLFVEDPEYLFGAVQFCDQRGEFAGFLGQYARSVIEQLLWRLGLSDLAYSNAGTLKAFRLHALQDLVWERRDALSLPTPEWAGELNVQWVAEPAGLALSPPVPVDVLRQVQRWAKPQGVKEGALHYALDLMRLYEAFKAGASAESLAEAWRANTDAPPPERLVDWWSYWWSRYGHVQLYPRQVLLEVQDEFAMQELQVAVPALRQALLAQLTPRAALIRRDHVGLLLEQLEAKDYMPKVLLTESAAEGGW